MYQIKQVQGQQINNIKRGGNTYMAAQIKTECEYLYKLIQGIL